MNVHLFFSISLSLACLLFVSPLALFGEGGVSVIYSAGTRGRILPVTIDGEERGGLALRKSFIDNLAADDERLVLSAGNFLFPHVQGLLDEGKTVVRCFDAAGYDVALGGSGDFRFGVTSIRERAAQANMAIIASNIIKKGEKFTVKAFSDVLKSEIDGRQMVRIPVSESPFPLFPVSVITRAGKKIAVLGMVSKKRYEESVSRCKEIEVISPFEVIDAVLPLLIESGIDTVIVVTTMTASQATKLGAIDGIDAVIVAVPQNASKEIKAVTEASISDGTKILFVLHGGLYLGQTTLSAGNNFSEAGRIRIDRNRQPDPQMEELIDKLDRDLISRFSTHITTLSSSAAKDFRKICAETARQSTNCEISLILKRAFHCKVNQGVMRSIDLWNFLPYGDTLSRTYMKGSYLKSVLDSKFDLFVAAGIRKQNNKWVINHRYLNPELTYSVTLNSIVANGAFNLIEKSKSKMVSAVELPGDFREIVQRELVKHESPELRDFRRPDKPVEFSTYSIAATVTRVRANDEAADYGDASVPGLLEESRSDVSALFRGEWKREDRKSDIRTILRTKYEEANSVRTIDELILEAHYEYVSGNLDGSRPYFNAELDTSLTANSLSGDERPYKLKLTMGYSFEVWPYTKFLIGFSNLRLFGSLEGDPTYGSDLTLRYDRDFKDKGITVSSRLNSYTSYQSNAVYQLKWETICSFKIVGNLSLRLNYDMLFYEDETIGGRAKSSQLFIGFGYQMFTRHF